MITMRDLSRCGGLQGRVFRPAPTVLGRGSNPPLEPDHGPTWSTKMQPLLSVPGVPWSSVPLLQIEVKESFWVVVDCWPTQGAVSVQSPLIPGALGAYWGSVGNHEMLFGPGW